MVAVTGAPGGDNLIRRAARLAQRAHGDLIGVHVHTDDGLTSPTTTLLDDHRRLLGELGGQFHQLTGSDVARTLVGFAHDQNATQVVLGASHRTRWTELVRGSVINDVIRRSGRIDIHVISTAGADDGRARCPPPGPVDSPPCPGAASWRHGCWPSWCCPSSPSRWCRAATRSSCRRCCSPTCVVVLAVAAVGGVLPGARRRPRRRSCWRTSTSRRRCTTSRSRRARTCSDCSPSWWPPAW